MKSVSLGAQLRPTEWLDMDVQAVTPLEDAYHHGRVIDYSKVVIKI